MSDIESMLGFNGDSDEEMPGTEPLVSNRTLLGRPFGKSERSYVDFPLGCNITLAGMTYRGAPLSAPGIRVFRFSYGGVIYRDPFSLYERQSLPAADEVFCWGM